MIKLQASVSRIIWVSAVLVAALFIFTRLYNLDQSLLFFGDLGRDVYVLQSWQESGKPPLLGPQTSALPFNQSATYFYLLYPAFLITSGSYFSSVYTLIIVYCTLFFLGLWLLRKQPRLQLVTLFLAVIFTIHPQMIIQNRAVWNPSFVPVFFGISVVSWLLLQKKWSRKTVALSSFFLALSCSFSYSVLPAAAVLVIATFAWVGIKKGSQFLGFSFLSAVLINAPTVAFEVRHNFFLTKKLLAGSITEQAGMELLIKAQRLWNYLLSPDVWNAWILFLILCIVFIYSWLNKDSVSIFFKRVLVLAISSLVLTLLMPVPIHSHYIFAILTLFALAMSTMPVRVACLAVLLMSFAWVTPQTIKTITQPAVRSVAEMQRCAETVCSQQDAALFVSTQASFHPHHDGFEWLYAFNKAGCDAKKIDYDPTAAQRMLVVADDSTYEHSKTSFYELSLFGDASESAQIHCGERITVHVLDK